MEHKHPKIFVVEDNQWYRKLLVHNLSLNPDYEVHGFESGELLMRHMKEMPDVVTLDYRLPGKSGVEMLEWLRENYPDVQVVMISEQDDIEVVVELLKKGAYDYLVKSDDIRDKLHNTVRHIMEGASLRRELRSLKKEVQKKYRFQDRIRGNSPAIKKVFQLMEKAVKTNITVSIFGETGTGKEVVAKAIHYNSDRKDGPLVAVNVAALPADLIESELFGHEKGAFTGAQFRRIGKFEEAHGGTLFLDEIGEMDMTFQTKLLRAIQEREIVRIGSNDPVKTDCRLLVATHRNLEQLVEEGKFREDLYYRLFGLSITLPPLRERGKDILLLARHFAESFCRENGMEMRSFSAEAQKKLLRHSYPGNVRELRSVVELAATLATEDQIGPDDIQFGKELKLDRLLDREMTLEAYNLRILDHLLNKYDHNITRVAEILDIGKATVYRMLKKRENAAETS